MRAHSGLEVGDDMVAHGELATEITGVRKENLGDRCLNE